MVEDDFCVGWFVFECVGVEFVFLVFLYEEVKICVFNVSYSCIVWVGMLLGLYIIDESVGVLFIYCMVSDYVIDDVILCFMVY